MNIGVFGLIVYRDKIILGKKNYGNYKWTLPGGSVELGEGIIEALIREVLEETGQEIDNIEYILTSYDKEKYSIAIIYKARVNELKPFSYSKDELQDVKLFSIYDLPVISDRQKEWINSAYNGKVKRKVLEI